MKRDFELIRKILLEIEKFPAGSPYCDLPPLDGYERQAVNEHIELLIEDGLIKGISSRSMEGKINALVQCLKSKGHDFLASSKNGVWEIANEKIFKPGLAITIDLLFRWLKAEAAEKLGMKL